MANADLLEMTIRVTCPADAIPDGADADVMHPLWDDVDDLKMDIERAIRREARAGFDALGIDGVELEIEGAF